MSRKLVRKIFAAPVMAICLCLCLSGCGTKRADVADAYDLYGCTDTYISYGDGDAADTEVNLFASDLCVGGLDNSESELVDDENATAAAVFTMNNGKVAYAKNIYEKRYPASTTKILTAYVALKYGDLEQIITVSDEAIDTLDPDSSVCGLKVGDQISLREALYGMLMRSGNDAANAVAEAIGGSQDGFAKMMNEEAAALGATGSHFTNAHGLPDENHYTTAYDLYLFFNAALQNQDFVDIISTETHDASYLDADGGTVNVTWTSTNRYFNGKSDVPEGVTVIGGKTGTTQSAGYCLVLYVKNAKGEPVISVVLGEDNRDDLYTLTSNLLTNFGN